MEPRIEITNETEANRRAGVVALCLMFLALPLVLAYLFAAWSLTLAAWDLMIGQF